PLLERFEIPNARRRFGQELGEIWIHLEAPAHQQREQSQAECSEKSPPWVITRPKSECPQGSLNFGAHSRYARQHHSVAAQARFPLILLRPKQTHSYGAADSSMRERRTPVRSAMQRGTRSLEGASRLPRLLH